jgi:hypothetical protein
MGLGDALLVWLAIGFSVVYGGGTYAAAQLGSWMAGIDAPPAHLVDLIAGLFALPLREGQGMSHCAFPAYNLPQSPRHRYN